jgi:hypothetical protein
MSDRNLQLQQKSLAALEAQLVEAKAKAADNANMAARYAKVRTMDAGDLKRIIDMCITAPGFDDQIDMVIDTKSEYLRKA